MRISDFPQGGAVGSSAATLIPGSGGACTGSGVVYGRGILVDGGSSGGADGNGHVGGQVKFLVMLQVMVRIVVLVQSWSDDALGIIVLLPLQV